MQFVNCSLDKLAKNLVDKDFSRQKGAYPYEYMSSFKRFNEDKLCARKYFYSSTKDKKLVKMVKYQMVM